MKDDLRDKRRVFGWALPASLVVHVIAGALLIFGLPMPQSKPQEEAVSVELVPPPQPPEKARPKPPAAAPKPERPLKAKAKKEDDKARPQPIPVLRPVVQFAEKDGGPRISREGESAEDSATSRAPSDRGSQGNAEPHALASAQAPSSVPLAGEPPPVQPGDAAKPQAASKLQHGKKLFSMAASGSLLATTAINDLPRSDRVAHLCGTELKEQLLHAWPPFFPQLGPGIGLDAGTVLDVPDASFIDTSGQLYPLAYRCEVDADARKVVSFTFHVGNPISR